MNIFLILDEQQIYANSIMPKILYADILKYPYSLRRSPAITAFFVPATGTSFWFAKSSLND